MKKYISIFILSTLFDIILTECDIENPILLANKTCVSQYCSKEDFISNNCIIDNIIIKIQWINNIIMVGEEYFRYQNLFKFSNGDLIFESSPYSYSNTKRILYGLKKNGRYYFRNKINNEMTSFFSLSGSLNKFESINAIFLNHGKEYFMSIGRLITHTEIFDFEKEKIYSAETADLINYNNSNLVDTLVYLNSTENCFIYPIIVKLDDTLYKIILMKFKFTLSESNEISCTIIKQIQKNNTFGEIAYCFKTENTIIICFYGYKNDSTYYNIAAFNEDLEELNEESIAYPENRIFTFFTAIHYKGESGIFFYYKYLNDTSTLYPYIFFKKYNKKNSKFENVFSDNNSIILDKIIFINDWAMNDLLKISDSKIGFFSSSKDKKILYIVLINIFDEYKIKMSYYKIKIFELYNFFFFQEINSIIYNKFIVFSSNFKTSSSPDIYYTSLIIFSYPNGTDSNIDVINYLVNNNDISIKNLFFNLSENVIIENNLFGYIYYGMIIQNFSFIGNISLVSFLSNKEVEIDSFLDKKDMIKINFINNNLEFKLNIEYAYIAIESEFEEKENFPIIISDEYSKEDKDIFNKNREKYIGRTLFFNLTLKQTLNFSCENIGCELCLEENKNYCITCKYNFTFDLEGNKICDKYEFSNEDILNNNCKNKEITVEQAKEIYEILKNNITKNNQNKTLIETSNFIFQLISLEEQKANIKENISYIDFGKCESILKKQTNNLLIILKTDIKNDKHSSTYVQYEIYDSINGNKIDLKECQEMNIDIYIPTILDNNSLYLFNDLKNNGYNIFNLNDSFYNDICGTYKTINGKDILLSDRVEDIYNPTIEKYHCQQDCEIKSYNDQYKKILCECPLEEQEIDIEVEEDFHQKFKSTFINTWKNSNFLVVKCYKYLINFKKLINNKGYIIMIIIIIIFIIAMIIYCFRGQQRLNELIKKILIIKKGQRKKSNIKIYKIKNDSIRNSEIKKLSHISLFSNNLNIKTNKKSKINKSKKNISDIAKNEPPKNNTKKIKNKSNSTNRVMNFRGKSKHNTNIKMTHNFNIQNIFINNRSDMMNDYELNNLEFDEAKKVDKRTFIEYYFSLLKLKNIIIFTFFYNQDYNLISIKISLFLLIFSLYFTINSFFFNDDTMHKIYKDNSSYNFIFQIPIILYSTIISSTINIILKYFSLSEKDILQIKKEKNYLNSKNASIRVKKCLRKKFIIFYILGMILLLFFCYFITCFCFVFCNTQIILIKDTFISFGLSILYPFLLIIFPGFLRVYSLNKNKKSIYRLSVILSLL